MFHKHHFVAPESLGFDSDGSMLVCDKVNCTAFIQKEAFTEYEKQQRRANTKRQGNQIKGMIVMSHFLLAVPFFFGASPWTALYYIPLVVWDYIMIKDALKRNNLMGGRE